MSQAPASGAAAGAPASEPAIGFVLRVGRALHSYGTPTPRLEEVLDRTSARLGVPGQFFSTPTSIFAAFGPQESQHTFLIRVEPGDVHLEKLSRLERVVSDVERGALTPGQGSERVEAIIAAPPRYGAALTTAAYGLASASASRFLGGGMAEIGVAAAIGIVIGLMAIGADRVPGARRVFEPLAAFAASALAAALTRVVGPFSVFNATLAGLIVLLPGLSLTTAMTELSTRHLAAGTARLSGALVVFLGIAFGVAMGGRIVQALLGAPMIAGSTPLAPWTEGVALVVAPLAFTVLLRAHPSDAGWVLASGVLAFVGGRLGAQALGPELGIFLGALIAGVTSNLFARVLDRPSAVVLVPAILMLVPGSIGFRSLASLLDREVVSGVETAFKMVLMLSALVAGLLIANIVAPPRRAARTARGERAAR